MEIQKRDVAVIAASVVGSLLMALAMPYIAPPRLRVGALAPCQCPQPTPVPSANVPLGIQQTQLVWTNKATIDATYQAIAKDLPGIKWLRADIQDNDSAEAANYVEELRQIHAMGAKALAMSSITAGDVGGGTFPYPLSKCDPAKVAARYTTYINAAKAAGQTIEAFEIGNELDTTGFNSDSPANVALFVQSYGAFLNAAIGAIRAGMPTAKIITVGFANEMSYDPSGHLANPPAALAQLKSWNGQNLLAKVDGYGMHVYPTPDNIAGWTQAIFAQYQAAGISDKPIWITEWGFHRAAFPYNGQPRSWADAQWLAHVQAYKGLSFAATFLFDFDGDGGDYDIFDGSALRQDEASVIVNWNK